MAGKFGGELNLVELWLDKQATKSNFPKMSNQSPSVQAQDVNQLTTLIDCMASVN